MAGLLAARVLTDFYDRVTLVERDVLDDTSCARRGVPQGKQPHAMLARCGQIIDELLPGACTELIADGAHVWSDGDLSRVYTRLGGHLVVRSGYIPDPSALTIMYASRPLIERHVRRRVRALPQVTIMDGHAFDGPVLDDGVLAGVRTRARADNEMHSLTADLVVDATGRGSRTPVFLEALGYSRPPEDRLEVNVNYVSMPVRIPSAALHEDLFIDMFAPGRTRGFAMSRCEGETWIVLVGTLGRDTKPPASRTELIEQARHLMPAHAFDALCSGEPLADIALHRFPASRWRRYDTMDRMPAGLLVTGDAVCSFNPIYGQGMTVAAIEAMALRDSLRRGPADLPRRFHRSAAKGIEVAWRTALSSDLSLPEVDGARTPVTKMTNAYIDRVLRAAETDPWVAQEFLLVTGMIAPPTRLLRPAMVRRVLTSSLRGRRKPGASVSAARA
ncbi:2-polyprenyl-6-methoxyphenol hydroxylase-like oxidoreductase [Mycolicibacterium sp. 018/SC-01/001]|nr:2-polyprenyl-6-methoxyphenol hydroxylase-like oxidoreductase [Mycolicibacterium sp. 018/SC-01/001]